MSLSYWFVGFVSVADALLQIAAGDRQAAATLCQRAAASSPLASHLKDYLDQSGSGDVYVDPDAFERFISGGSNVALYAATITALAHRNQQQCAISILDIGCGDGRITTATVPDSCKLLHLLEPSEEMLQTAVARIGQTETSVESTSATLQDLLADEPARRWNAAQSTFALHNLTPRDRDDALTVLASRTGSIAIVEFDVPGFADRSHEHAVYAANAYETGIAEYDRNPKVITGFLLPVLVGQFAPDQPRHTYEQPIDAWAQDLRHAGFKSITTTPVAEFWWANAWLVHGITSNLTES